MEHDSSTEIEVDAYLSGSVVEALKQKSENQDSDLNSTINNANVEIQAGYEDFKVQCQNIGKGPDGVFRMCVLDNGEVITSLKNHIDSYSTSEIINNGFEGVYEDNSETILNIASESIQSTQFLENAVAKDSFISTIQETNVRNSCETSNTFLNEIGKDLCGSYLSDANIAADILKDLELAKFKKQTSSVTNKDEVDQFFMPDFETLLWNENNMLEPSYSDIIQTDTEKDGNEYIDIGDFAFLLKDDKKDQKSKNELSEQMKCNCENRKHFEDKKKRKIVVRCPYRKN